MKKVLYMFAIGLLVLSTATAAGAQTEVFSKEIEEILEKKINLANEKLVKDPLIVKAVRGSNEKNKDITLSEIKRLDDRWMATEGIDEFIKGFLVNDCAKRLIEFQDAHYGYPEIFVADEKGLIVGETNKTSDYYQADEDWWIKGYNKGRGHSFHGDIEYDESAMSEAIAAYIPIMDPDTKKAIGVMKVVIDITSIKMEL